MPGCKTIVGRPTIAEKPKIDLIKDLKIHQTCNDKREHPGTAYRRSMVYRIAPILPPLLRQFNKLETARVITALK